MTHIFTLTIRIARSSLNEGTFIALYLNCTTKLSVCTLISSSYGRLSRRLERSPAFNFLEILQNPVFENIQRSSEFDHCQKIRDICVIAPERSQMSDIPRTVGQGAAVPGEK